MHVLNLSGRTNTSKNTGDSRKTWTWMLVDSVIIGGISLFTELVTGPPSYMGLWKATMAFGLAFMVQLAVERGLKRE